jgi:two-component system CheB/CheR fusion protein
MSSMLDKLLDINQLEAGVVRPDIVDFPIDGLLDHLKTEFTYHASEKGLGWRVVPSRLTIRSDPRLLEQMLRNLLSNAVKYTKQGKILLGCRRRGDKLRIEVLDTGIGIPAGEVRRIFVEFHQLDNPARENSRGLGLGLSIVKRLGDLLNHSIYVRSSPGSGSVFEVEVPQGDAGAVRISSPQDRAKDDEAPLSGTILVIEDDPAVREMIKLLLDAEGHRTSVASDGQTALKLAAQPAIRPDLVIADYNLPRDANGLDVVERLQRELGVELPAIVLTGDISTETLREIARHGCTHLNKPVKAQELTRLIRRLLAKARTPEVASVPELGQPLDGRKSSTVFVVDDEHRSGRNGHRTVFPLAMPVLSRSRLAGS